MRIGIDIGSTTIKCVVLDDAGVILHKSYERHYAMITEKTQGSGWTDREISDYGAGGMCDIGFCRDGTCRACGHSVCAGSICDQGGNGTSTAGGGCSY